MKKTLILLLLFLSLPALVIEADPINFTGAQLNQMMLMSKALDTHGHPSDAYFMYQVLATFHILDPAKFVGIWCQNFYNTLQNGAGTKIREVLFSQSFKMPIHPSETTTNFLYYYLAYITHSRNRLQKLSAIATGWSLMGNYPLDWDNIFYADYDDYMSAVQKAHKLIQKYEFKGIKGYNGLDYQINGLLGIYN